MVSRRLQVGGFFSRMTGVLSCQWVRSMYSAPDRDGIDLNTRLYLPSLQGNLPLNLTDALLDT